MNENKLPKCFCQQFGDSSGCTGCDADARNARVNGTLDPAQADEKENCWEERRIHTVGAQAYTGVIA